MTNERFLDAKLVWLESTTSGITNLFKDKTDYFTHHINYECISRSITRCQDTTCPEPHVETREATDITVR